MHQMVFMFLLFLVVPAYSCVNTDGDPPISYSDTNSSLQLRKIIGRINYPTYDGRLAFNVSRKAPTPNNLAIVKLFEGKFQEAITMLTTEELKNPGQYNTAVNLGTLYELTGENEKALSWIREGIKRNPNSHQGTEWLHEVILLKKLKQLDEADGASLLSIPLFQVFPTQKINKKEYSYEEIRKALIYQLKERVLFVKPTEEIVANLFFELAKIELSHGNPETAKEYTVLSKAYGFSGSLFLFNAKLNFLSALFKGTVHVFWMAIVLVLMSLWVLWNDRQVLPKSTYFIPKVYFAIAFALGFVLFLESIYFTHLQSQGYWVFPFIWMLWPLPLLYLNQHYQMKRFQILCKVLAFFMIVLGVFYSAYNVVSVQAIGHSNELPYLAELSFSCLFLTAMIFALAKSYSFFEYSKMKNIP